MEIPYYDISLLYVEDDELTRENVVQLLKRLVAKLHVASNGQDGLDLFRTHYPESMFSRHLPRLFAGRQS